MKLTPYIDPKGGLFLWVEMPENIDIIEMSNQAADQGIMLVPGNLFSPHQELSQWMRFNVASCNEPPHLSFLKKTISNGIKKT